MGGKTHGAGAALRGGEAVLLEEERGEGAWELGLRLQEEVGEGRGEEEAEERGRARRGQEGKRRGKEGS